MSSDPKRAVLPTPTAAQAASCEPRDIISIGPKPVVTLLAGMTIAGRHVSAVTRVFADGDTGRCSLCPTCTARRNVCMVMVAGRIDEASAASLSLHGRRVRRLADGPPDGGVFLDALAGVEDGEQFVRDGGAELLADEVSALGDDAEIDAHHPFG